MPLDTWLRIGAIGLPLIGALIIWCWGDRFPGAQRWLATLIFSAAGLIALSLFLLNRQYSCILASGRQNCLFDGLATLSLFLLSLVLARGSVVLPGINKRRDYMLMLGLSSAWAGMGLAENLLALLLFMNLFFYVIYRWLKRRGLTWRILLIGDDYKNDFGPK